MGTTSRGYPYPDPDDRVIDGDDAMQALAEAVNDDVASLPVSAAGSVFMPGPTSMVHVNLPAGRFTSAPMVNVTATTGGNVALVGAVGNPTAAGFDIYVYGIGGTWNANAVSFFWHAVEAH